MPFIGNVSSVRTRAANIVMSRAFFPRAKKWIYPELSSSYISTSEVEPHRIIGAMPGLTRFRGHLKTGGIPSYNIDVPNLLFKNLASVDQEDFEFDQTGTMIQLAPQMGQRLAEFPDLLWAKRVLSGDTTASKTVNYKGKSYSLVMDGQPYFATAHPCYDDAGSTYANLIQMAGWPTAKANLFSSTQDWSVLANKMQQALSILLDKLALVKDNAGLPIYQNLDTEESVVIVVPRILEPAARLAFATKGSILTGGGSGGGSFTNIAPQYVKKVISSSLLNGGFLDPDPTTLLNSGDGSLIGTTDNAGYDHACNWYAFIVNDFVKPFYYQLFRPVKPDEMFPRGYDPAKVVAKIMKENDAISVEEATMFASTRIDTTFRRIGAEADLETIKSERFYMSARHRGNLTYGPAFTAYKFSGNGS